MFFQKALVAFCLFLTVSAVGPFTYNHSTFLLHGKPFQIIGGQMDPQRIPHQLWPDRLAKARAMGLNTIFSYVYWDQLEPIKGSWESTGNNDIAKYFKIAQEQGLNIVLRPGPYVCGEHEWGGFPSWLSEVPGMVVRSNNKAFLTASESYLQNLAKDLKPLLIENGGPILMVQVENEYGSYGDDHEYIGALRDMLKSESAFGPDVHLYTNDGGQESMIKGGQISGALAESDGDPKTGFAARDKYITDPSSLGPQLDGEYYVTWLDQWASNNTHQTDSGNGKSIQAVQSDLDWILKQNASFSIYMVHGGTNWGFQNGADWGDALEPITTSYDYGAPIDESGRMNDIYHAIRQTIASHIGSDNVPDLVKEEPLIEIPDIKLTPSGKLFDSLPDPVWKEFPVNMEALGQAVGFTLYRHVAVTAMNGTIQAGDAPRDRILVYVNGHRVGVIDSLYVTPNIVEVSLDKHDVLDLLVENMGRVNYGARIVEQRKGIVGNVTLGDNVLSGWQIYSLPLPSPPEPSPSDVELSGTSSPVLFEGHFDVDTVGDTFLELPGWTKGVVWVNGINLGRYWTIGPQQTLYLPGCYLQEKKNRITVLALEPTGQEGNVRGIKTRNWGNNPDPDGPSK